MGGECGDCVEGGGGGEGVDLNDDNFAVRAGDNGVKGGDLGSVADGGYDNVVGALEVSSDKTKTNT